MPRGKKKTGGVAGRLEAILTQIHLLQVDLAAIEREVSAYNNDLKAMFGGTAAATPVATPVKQAKPKAATKPAKAGKRKRDPEVTSRILAAMTDDEKGMSLDDIAKAAKVTKQQLSQTLGRLGDKVKKLGKGQWRLTAKGAKAAEAPPAAE